jgi:cobalt-zinc-cadmium efflux system protein
MGHGHHHHDHSGAVSRKLVIATLATGVFVVVEAGAGIYANSLALVGDAMHNFTDALALLLALVAVRIERRPATTAKSYGYQRAGVLAAFVNAATLAAFTLYIFVEAWQRFRRPEAIDTNVMSATAAAALVLNTAITIWLRREGTHDLNVRAAVIHTLGDAISSAGIIVTAWAIHWSGRTVLDPLMTVLIGVMILWSSWGVLRESINLLLEGTPSGIDPDAVAQALADLEGVHGVHHLHIWAIAPSRPALSCHLMLGDVPLKSTDDLLKRATTMLEEEFHIVHTTMQLEFANCAEGDPYCIPFTAKSEVVRRGSLLQ